MDNNNMKYIQTDNLTVINYGDGSGKLQIYNKTKSSYGWSPRSLIVSLFGKPLKEITYNYVQKEVDKVYSTCLLYTSPSPRDRTRSRMPSSA